MKVNAIMSKTVVTIEMDDTLRVVKDIFDNAHFHHLLVVDSGKLYGVISDRDLLRSLSPNIGTANETAKDTATLNKKAHQIMTRKPVVIDKNFEIYEAIGLINHHGVSCLPVVDEEFRPVGLLSWRDIFKFIEAKMRSEAQKG